MNIRHLLLDIEGTTCPVSFVSDTLFPYARQSLSTYIASHRGDQVVQDILNTARKEWGNDNTEASLRLRDKHQQEGLQTSQAITDYLLHLIDIDKKSTALKDLQGKIWLRGYQSGEIKAELFPEIPACFQQWGEHHLAISSYSSGSIQAQKLIYEYSNSGDLTRHIHQWFDTHTGPKKSAQSYSIISKKLDIDPETILFISDNAQECDAAQQVGMRTLFSKREGNPDQNPQGHATISSLNEEIAHL